MDDPVRLFNGRDGEWQARIAALRRDKATIVALIASCGHRRRSLISGWYSRC